MNNMSEKEKAYLEGYQEGYNTGRELLMQDIKVLWELTEGDDPYQAKQYAEDSYHGEELELLSEIFNIPGGE